MPTFKKQQILLVNKTFVKVEGEEFLICAALALSGLVLAFAEVFTKIKTF